MAMPRSGNTLLASIINQNPKVACTANSITLEIMKVIYLLKEDETFKPEGENDQQSAQKESAFHEDQNAEDEEAEIEEDFNDKDDHFFEVLKISEDSPRDFDSIKSTYRKKIAQYHPDKVSAMGPEIQEVAEEKAKEINEAYEHFRKKFSS